VLGCLRRYPTRRRQHCRVRQVLNEVIRYMQSDFAAEVKQGPMSAG
jgi:hypothetical protein